MHCGATVFGNRLIALVGTILVSKAWLWIKRSATLQFICSHLYPQHNMMRRGLVPLRAQANFGLKIYLDRLPFLDINFLI